MTTPIPIVGTISRAGPAAGIQPNLLNLTGAVQIARNSTDERKAMVSVRTGETTLSQIGDVAIPEPDPRILRRFAIRGDADPFTPADFLGADGMTSYSRTFGSWTPTITTGRGAFALPKTSVADEYFAVPGDLAPGTALGLLDTVTVNRGIPSVWSPGVVIAAAATDITIDGREYRYWNTDRGLGAWASAYIPIIVRMAWLHIPS
ncbi:hypothetical protein [Candidatus Poriferisodalis sp.]|uniref:hypothetical protein n=1 Tax=Candidatus Poriferisodalis sp. TaxID=3101277 RepID=UPI003B01BE90